MQKDKILNKKQSNKICIINKEYKMQKQNNSKR